MERIVVEPDDREVSVLVRRALGLRAGEYVESTVLVQSKAKLEATGLFESVSVHTVRGSRPGAIVLVAEADIGRRIQVETGIGHEDFNGWYLNILGLRWTSPLRRGGSLRFGLHEGLGISGVFIDGEVPEVGGENHDLLLDVAFFSRTWVAHDGSQEFTQQLGSAQTWLGLRRNLSSSSNAAVWAGYSLVEPDGTIVGADEQKYPAERLFPDPDLDLDHFLETRAELLFDRTDPQSPWQRRMRAGAQLRLANRIGGSTFLSLQAEGRLAVPAPGGGAGAFRLRSAWTGSETPYHQRFPVGGVRSLRGYSFARLSGPRGAEALWSGSAEWRQPLLGKGKPQPRVLGTVFVDVGDHWDERGRRGGIAAGGGYGVQIQIPWIQVLTVEVSYPITNRRSSDPVAIYASLGRSF